MIASSWYILQVSYARLEEGEGASFHGAWERFKALVTRGTISINVKYEKVRAVVSRADDRRTVIFQAQQHAHQRDRAWFDKVYATRARPAVIKHIAQRRRRVRRGCVRRGRVRRGCVRQCRQRQCAT